MRTPPPGAQLARGRLRVDAAKAIAKLRDYQLVDRTAWILEAIRAAVAGGATDIALTGDANDVWLSWQGPAWPAQELPRLFDELVSPDGASERHHLRLLAAAVNSALGIDPAFVDVYTVTEAGAFRARYLPDALIVDDDRPDALHAGELIAVDRPRALAPASGMLVHVRRRVALPVIGYWLLRREPAELTLARDRCRDLAVPLTIGGDRVSGDHRDFARVPFGDDLAGFVALTDTPPGIAPQSILEIAERGVVLVRFPLELRANTTNSDLTPPPIRVWLDAPRMPTNVSRSSVRRDEHPIRAAEQRIAELVGRLVEQLAARVTEERATNPRTVDVALAWLASRVGGSDWQLPLLLLDDPLATVPLLRDAAGQLHPPRRSWDVGVYTGSKPVAAALAGDVSTILWAPPGDSTHRMLGTAELNRARADAAIKRARKRHSAYQRFLSQAPRGTLVAPGYIRVRSPFAALYPERRGGEVIVLLDGRELERIRLASSPLPFVASIEHAGIIPRDDYRGAEPGPGLEIAIRTASRAAIDCARALAERLAGGSPSADFTVDPVAHPSDHELLRGAVRLAGELGVTVGLALAEAAIWPTTRGNVSTALLRRCRVIGRCEPGHTVRGIGDRVVVEGIAFDVLQTVARDVQFVDYGSRVVTPLTSAQLATTVSCGIAIDGPHGSGAIGYRRDVPSTIELFHCGVALASAQYVPRLLRHCTIAIDAPDVVPDPSWQFAGDTAGLTEHSYLEWEHEWVRGVARRLIGEPGGVQGNQHEFAAAYLEFCRAIVITKGAPLDRELRLKLLRAPLVRRLGERTMCSLAELCGQLSPIDPIVHVPADSEPAVGFTAIADDEIVAGALAVIACRDLVDGTAPLADHRARHRRAERLTVHRTKARLAELPPEHSLSIQVAAVDGRGWIALGDDHLELQIAIESRPFTIMSDLDDLPLIAMVDLPETVADDDFVAVQTTVVESVVTRVRIAACELVCELARNHRNPAAIAAWRRLVVELDARDQLDEVTRGILRAAVRWRTIDGEHVRLSEIHGSRAVIAVARWQDGWLARGDDEPEHVLDHTPVLAISDDDTLAIVERLSVWPIVDETERAVSLQRSRRAARGLVPRPRLPTVDDQWKRPLESFGNAAALLGPGEIGLVPAGATAVLHHNGEPRWQLALDVVPRVLIAIEQATPTPHATQSPNAATLAARVQPIACQLAEQVVANRRHSPLPRWLLDELRLAVVAGRLREEVVRGVTLLPTNRGELVELKELAGQVARFGDLWLTSRPLAGEPSDSDRYVFVVSPFELTQLAERYLVRDAAVELAADDQLRRNQARPKRANFEVRADIALAIGQLTGDGITAPRGTVAVLDPKHAGHRGVHPHRALHPFASTTDRCDWPTLAVIDDARLTPDRTWATIEQDGAWNATISAIRHASAEALTRVAGARDAVVELSVTPTWLATLPRFATVQPADRQLCGRLWLATPPRIASSDPIRVHGPTFDHSTTAVCGLTGTLYVYCALSDSDRDAVLAAGYAQLVLQLVDRMGTRMGTDDRDFATAHIAHAVAVGSIWASDAPRVTLDCFRPALSIRAFSELLATTTPIPRWQEDATGLAIVDDGSATARVVHAILGGRVIDPSRAATRSPLPSIHPIAAIARRVRDRLHDLGCGPLEIRIDDDRASPLLRFERTDRVLVFAGAAPRLRAIAASEREDPAIASAACDALVHHAATLLNAALTAFNSDREAHVLVSQLAGS